MIEENYSLHYMRWHRDDADYFKSWHMSGGRRSLPLLVGHDRNKRVLDFGCGIGLAVHSLIASGYNHVHGIDADEHQIEIARKHGLPCELVSPSDQDRFFQALAAPFDVILMLDVLEHIPKESQPRVLGMMRKSLAPNGHVVIKTPNAAGPMSGYQRFIDFTHQCSYTPESLEYVLALAGFKIAKYMSNGHPRLDKITKLPWFLIRWMAFLVSRAIWRAVYIGELGMPGIRLPLDRDLLVTARPANEFS